MTALPARSRFAKDAAAATPDHDDIVIGKDVLELLSSAMYVDPLSIYREYVQNAADAIDEANRANLLPNRSDGRLDIAIDIPTRTVRLRDNGTGLPISAAPLRLLSIGASSKRGSRARGFRGVGRLAGLAYCRQLTFRTRAAGDQKIVELSWDCQKLKTILRTATHDDDLVNVIGQVVTVAERNASDWPSHFFEVEMADVIRYRNDVLLNPAVIGAYLSQVAPVPFHNDFGFADAINEFVANAVSMGDMHITLSGYEGPITRPHANRFMISDKVSDQFHDIETFELAGIDGNVAARGWILHHSYVGALPDRTLIKGLRLRAGNIQVGSSNILEERFPEERFNAWTVGEIHVIDQRILPNGRRDHFEQNNHYTNLTQQLTPIARSIAKRCREASVERNRLREFERQADVIRQKTELVGRPAVPAESRQAIIADANNVLASMARLSAASAVRPSNREYMLRRIKELTRSVNRQQISKWDALLETLSDNERSIYEEVLSTIIELTDHQQAQQLIDALMAKLTKRVRRDKYARRAKQRRR